MRRATALVVVALLCVLLPLAAAHAAFPGQNGKIAFVREGDIWSVNPDVAAPETNLTTSAATEAAPAWSPDGQKIVLNRYTPGPEIVVMNADGSGQMSLGNGFDPSWSPDGSKIVFVAPEGECAGPEQLDGVRMMNPDGTARTDVVCISSGSAEPVWSPDGGLIALTASRAFFDIFTVQPDGNNLTNLTGSENPMDTKANWSPDATRIVWSRSHTDGAVWIMNRDGTGQSELIPNAGDPAWSPDGTKIAGNGLTVYNADGTGGTFLTSGSAPSWQPVPINAYPRPKAASPMQIALVPAYTPCSDPNRAHGPPLAFDSCNPPAQTSTQLTVGTPDANGRAAASSAYVRLAAGGESPIDPNNGDQSDVKIKVSITDVRNTSDLSDHTGELTVKIGRRITDKDNTPHPGGPGAATTEDHVFSFSVPCTATGGAAGATCSLTTTADTLVPGTVVERKRAIWQFDRVAVHDASDDPFLTQGVFVP